ncbi:MAG: sigma-70 family RNA polymerase sigma factor [Bacteroidota bacterium]
MNMTTSTTTQLSAKASDDYRLVQQAIEGNQRAYADLLNRYRASVFHTMLKMVNNRDDADDLTIEAFGKAFRKLSSYTPHYAFSTWLFRIAINNCIDHIRKKRLHILSIDDPIDSDGEQDFSANIRSDMRNPEEIFMNTQKIQLMRILMGRLSEKYRLMIELRYFEELSYDEIAQELNIPLGTVKAQLFRAKEMLYELLQKPGASAYLDTTKRKNRKRKTAKMETSQAAVAAA